MFQIERFNGVIKKTFIERLFIEEHVVKYVNHISFFCKKQNILTNENVLKNRTF